MKNIISFVLVLVFVLTLVGSVATGGIVFLDDFEDGSATDGAPVTWSPVRVFLQASAQDADQDGFPDEGQDPVVCVPWGWTAKRLTIMPGYVPTLLPE